MEEFYLVDQPNRGILSPRELIGEGLQFFFNRGLDQQSCKGELSKIDACGPSKRQRFCTAFMYFVQFLIPDRCGGVGK